MDSESTQTPILIKQDQGTTELNLGIWDAVWDAVGIINS